MIVVAIPAHDEAERIAACLEALTLQSDLERHVLGVVVYANNCRDATATIARSVKMPVALQVIEADLPPEQANIGWARRGATEGAKALFDRHGIVDGIIACTDADSRVAAGWLAAMVEAFADGADAVAGEIEIDPADKANGAELRDVESEYAAMVARVNAILDPVEHDPWPNHIWAWGANLAVRTSVLEAIGGVPLVDLAEDRMLHERLVRHDARVRHSIAARVWTSGRHDGRAPGGFADLLANYREDPDALADFWLEPAAMSWKRASCRGQARKMWLSRGTEGLADIGSQLGADVPDTEFFGGAWAAITANSPHLQQERVLRRDLPREKKELERLLSRFNHAS